MKGRVLTEFDMSKSAIEDKLLIGFWIRVIYYRRHLHLEFELWYITLFLS